MGGQGFYSFKSIFWHSQALAAALERAEAEAKQARERAADHERSSSRRAHELETQLEVVFLFSFAFVFSGCMAVLCFRALSPFPKKKLALTLVVQETRGALQRVSRELEAHKDDKARLSQALTALTEQQVCLSSLRQHTLVA